MQTLETKLAPPLAPLAAAQNPDGGWPYLRGQSWTEPTVYALLSLGTEPAHEDAVRRGRAWLSKLQRADGGWAPHPSVGQSTWVTALVVLLEAERPLSPARDRAVEWLLRQTGEDATWVFRLRRWMLGARSDYDETHRGWPWYPATAAWAAPTSLTLLALEKIQKRRPDSRVGERIESGRRFLLSRMCQDGGWNHGASRSLGYQANSYPETTGLALAALHGAEPAKVARSLASAEAHLARCRSVEGISWLRLGLLAHGRKTPSPGGLPERTVLERALRLLTEQALAGRNVFWS